MSNVMPRLNQKGFEKKDVLKFMNWREFNYSANISLKHKYLYIETPKVACSTIKKSLMQLEIDDLEYNQKKIHVSIFESPLLKPYQLPQELLSEVLFGDSFFRFSFVRNPYTRVLSAYLEKILRNHVHARALKSLLGLDPDDNDTVLTFDQFIQALGETDGLEQDRHWRPQYLLLLDGLLEMHFIGRFETFADDWDLVAERISGQPSEALKKVQWHATNADKKLSQFYTRHSANLVAQLYNQDFSRYGYEIKDHAVNR